MFKLDDTVRIKKTGVIGTISDISGAGGETTYVIDTDTGDDEDDFGGMRRYTTAARMNWKRHDPQISCRFRRRIFHVLHL